MNPTTTWAKAQWTTTPMPAVVVRETIGPDLAAAARARLSRAGYTRYALLDRASYELREDPDEPELLGALLAIGREVTGRPLDVIAARALRLSPGDYLLLRHDRAHEESESPVELTLDLLPAEVPGAEVHYRHRGQVFFTFPSTPGALAIVERGPTVMCNHTYVSRRLPSASVVRLVVLARAT